MSAPFPLPDRIDIYRPFGAGTPTSTDKPARLVPNLRLGRGGTAGPTYLMWTHFVDVDISTQIKDGCTRTAGQNYVTYADGDEIRATVEGVALRFVVVWVEDRYTNTDKVYRRAYLVRSTRTI